MNPLLYMISRLALAVLVLLTEGMIIFDVVLSRWMILLI